MLIVCRHIRRQCSSLISNRSHYWNKALHNSISLAGKTGGSNASCLVFCLVLVVADIATTRGLWGGERLERRLPKAQNLQHPKQNTCDRAKEWGGKHHFTNEVHCAGALGTATPCQPLQPTLEAMQYNRCSCCPDWEEAHVAQSMGAEGRSKYCPHALPK